RTGCSPHVVVYWPHRAPCPWSCSTHSAGPRRSSRRITPVARPRPLVLGCDRSRWPVGVARRRSAAAHGKDSLKVRGPTGGLSTMCAGKLRARRRVAPACPSALVGDALPCVIIATLVAVPGAGKGSNQVLCQRNCGLGMALGQESDGSEQVARIDDGARVRGQRPATGSVGKDRAQDPLGVF